MLALNAWARRMFTKTRFRIERAIETETDECILWDELNHSIPQNRYPRVRHQGKTVRVNRMICERIYGPPPTSEHEAAHRCGNRLCINKRHLRWATSAENKADRKLHGIPTTTKCDVCGQFTNWKHPH